MYGEGLDALGCAKCDYAQQGAWVGATTIPNPANMSVPGVYYPGEVEVSAHFHGTFTTRYNAKKSGFNAPGSRVTVKTFSDLTAIVDNCIPLR